MLIVKVTGKGYNVFAVTQEMARLAGKLTLGEIARLKTGRR